MLRNPKNSIKLLSVCAGFLITWGIEKKKLSFNGIYFIWKVSVAQFPAVSLLSVQVLSAVKPHKDGRRGIALIYHPPFSWERVESGFTPHCPAWLRVCDMGQQQLQSCVACTEAGGISPKIPSPEEPR